MNFVSIFPIFQIDNFNSINKITLRELKINDPVEVKRIFEIYNIHEIKQYLPNDCFVNNFIDAKNELLYFYDLFYKKVGIFWGISIDNNLIGTCGFHEINKIHSKVKISCDLDMNFWNQGIMSKCLSVIINYVFTELNINRIEAYVETDNLKSIKLFQKLNFKKEGLLKQYEVRNIIHKDFYIYAKLKSEK